MKSSSGVLGGAGLKSGTPFVESIPVDKTDEEMEGVETRTYENGRVQHINLHNVSFADAIRFSNVLSSAKKKRDDDL